MDNTSQPPAAPKKDKLLLKIVLGGCGCLLLIAIAAGLLFGKFFGWVSAPAQTVKEHLKAINEGQYSQAYVFFSRSYKQSHSLEEFRANVRSFSAYLPYTGTRLNKVNVQNNRAQVSGTLTARGGAIVPVEYDLEREQGEWRITDYRWVSPGQPLQT